ncbi:MAG: hydantoinase/oxoprolinase family protein [Halolamina sp.]|uniref:hydantoinase/oxoprolinase family protein n=1 Tax=Halolamina sp. TaxID=1940283 RepID=UPI002FC387E8
MSEHQETTEPDHESVRVGVDIGGTFTDVVTVQNGEISVTKVPSTPENPEQGVIDGLEASKSQANYTPTQVDFFSHGTTVATNAVLEGTWAETALVTTEGFRDALEIGRQDRPDIYDFMAEKPEPIVPRDRRFTVPERLDERGRVLTELDEDAVRAVAADIEATGVGSVAISLLFAFENDGHEQRVAEILAEELPEYSLSVSSQVLPEIREYERSVTTALNAALKPVMDNYIGALESEISDRGIATSLKLMQSNGGLIDAGAARDRPVNTLLSGPAGGVQGATHVAARAGYSDVITMDMGGTSCDVSLVQDGDPVVSTDVDVGDYTVGVPMIDVHTVGSGGGSIAWVDAGDALRVGPRSAGADPGPICYGRGGTKPTTTDAHLLLGRIDPEGFLPEDREVGIDDVRAGFEELCDELGMRPEEAAQGVLDVANANMARALRVVSVEQGHDPREFALVAFGGAGPLHAPTLAAELDIPTVLVPRTAGVLSAQGLLISDIVYDYSRSRVRPWADVDPATVATAFAELRTEGDTELDSEGIAPERRRFERTADLRYVGQSFDVSVPVPDGEVDAETLDTVEHRFHERHEKRYGHADPEEPVELVTLRLRARGVVDEPALEPAGTGGTVADAISEHRDTSFDGEVHETPVYDRDRLPASTGFEGPAVVEGEESTVVVRPGQSVSVDVDGTLAVDTGVAQ